MSEIYFNLFMAFGNPNIYLGFKNEHHAIRLEMNYDADHAVWEHPSVEYHHRCSRTDEKEHICGLFGDDSCWMTHEVQTFEAGDKCMRAMNLQDTDAVYEILEELWDKRDDWMKANE